MQIRIISPCSPLHLAGAQVSDLPLGELADAGVADPHPAAEGEIGPGLLAADEDRDAASRRSASTSVTRKRTVPPSPSRAAVPMAAGSAPCQQVGIALGLPVLDDRVEQLAGPGGERVAVAPVGAELGESPPAPRRSLLSVKCAWRT